jgi:hypothetical protein
MTAKMTDDVQSSILTTGVEGGKEWAKLEIQCDSADPTEILLNVIMSIAGAFNACPVCLAADAANTMVDMLEEGAIEHGPPVRMDN